MSLRKPLYLADGYADELPSTDAAAVGGLVVTNDVIDPANRVGVDAGGFCLSNVADPLRAQDAATRAYVDAAAFDPRRIVVDETFSVVCDDAFEVVLSF
jgi:hypothetical protein